MMKKLPGDLPDSIVKQIKDYIIKDSELTSETPIGIGVFDLLRKKSTIVFYPLEEEDNDAFLLEKMPSYSGVINFVYINTAKTIEKQVFAAAHELGHLLDISNNINCEEKQDDSNERIVNRFAAELLMPEDLFKKEFVKATYKYVSNNSITLEVLLKVIVKLMNTFSVPYDAVVLRIGEIGVISESDLRTIYEGSENLSRTTIDEFIKKLISSERYENLQIRTFKKDIEGLDELLKKAEKIDGISANLIKRLRKRYDIPSDVVMKSIINEKLQMKEGR